MEMKEYTLDFGKNKTTRFAQASCWHYGNPNICKEGLSKFLERVRGKMPWVHVGDMVECILPGDNRFDICEHVMPVTEAVQKVSFRIKSAKETCMGVVMGNHEWSASKKIGDQTEDIANRAEVPYLGVCASLDLETPKGMLNVFVAHGKGAMGFNSGFPERDKLNRELKLRRILHKFHADLAIVGHFHRTIIAPALSEAMGMRQGNVFKRRPKRVIDKWVAACPSLFRNYHEAGTGASYAEIGLMPPTDIGWLEYVINRDGTVACVEEMDEKGKVIECVEERYVV